MSLVPETRSELVVPLVHKDRVIGVFDLESPVLDRFTEEHVKVLTPAREPGGGARSRTRGSTPRSAQNDERLSRELRIARDDPARALPRGLALGRGLGGLGPLPPRARARRRPLRLLRHGRAASSASRPATWPARASRRRSTPPSPRAPSARGPSSGARRPTCMQRREPHRCAGAASRASSARSPTRSSTSRTARCASRTPGCPTRSTTGRADRRARPIDGLRAAARDLRRGGLRRGRDRARRRATWSSSTPTASSRRARGARSTGTERLLRGLEAPRGAARARRSASGSSRDLEDFLGGETPGRRRDARSSIKVL